MGKLMKKTAEIETPSLEKKLNRRHSLLGTQKLKSPRIRRKTLGSAPTESVKIQLSPRKRVVAEVQNDEEVASDTIVNIDGLNIKENTVKSGIQTLLKLLKLKTDDQNKLFDDSLPIFLQITCIKIPKCPVRSLRLNLTHSLLNDSGEICLITADVSNYQKKDHDKAVEKYETLLQTKGITNIKKIMPFHELKTEYDQYELKRKLVGMYDVLLVEGKISKQVAHKLGNIFRNKRKLPIPVKLHVPNLKEHIESALRKTVLNIHPNGDNFITQVAHCDMKETDIFENIFAACRELVNKFPGGAGNIRGLNIKTFSSMSVPIYYSLKNASDVTTPVVKSNRPRNFKTMTGELSTLYGTDVVVDPTGSVTLIKGKARKSEHKPTDNKNNVGPEINGKEDKVPNKKLRVKKKKTIKTDEGAVAGKYVRIVKEDGQSEDENEKVSKRKRKKTVHKGKLGDDSEKSDKKEIVNIIKNKEKKTIRKHKK